MLVRIFRIFVTVVATALACAGPAAADNYDFVRTLHDKYVFLSDEQLVSESVRVCAATRSDMTSPRVVDMVRRDLDVETSVAFDIAATAVVALSCGER
jgi:hypothetical protein